MRNLPSRIARLERTVASRPPAPCPRCGTPKGYVAGFVARDPEGRPLNPEYCDLCSVEICGGKAISPINPLERGFREVLILPRGSAPLPV